MMRHRELLIRLVLTAALLYALGHYASARLTLRRTELLADELSARRDALAAEQASLTDTLASLRSGEGLEAAARQRLGLVRPGELIFYFSEDGAEEPPA